MRLTLRAAAGVAAFSLVFALEACKVAPQAESSPEPDATSRPGETAPPERSVDGPPRVLFLGTSLTAGLGLSEDEAYPARVAALLGERGVPVDAVNAGVSGDTSAGGLNRLDWLLRAPPKVVLIELGANDGLRGLPVAMTEANLLEAIKKSRESGARVVVAGMMMPPNYGEDYTRAFAEIFPRVAEQTDSILIPFLLEGVAADPDLNQADGIHPNAEGQERIARVVLPYLLEALGR